MHATGDPIHRAHRLAASAAQPDRGPQPGDRPAPPLLTASKDASPPATRLAATTHTFENMLMHKSSVGESRSRYP